MLFHLSRHVEGNSEYKAKKYKVCVLIKSHGCRVLNFFFPSCFGASNSISAIRETTAGNLSKTLPLTQQLSARMKSTIGSRNKACTSGSRWTVPLRHHPSTEIFTKAVIFPPHHPNTEKLMRPYIREPQVLQSNFLVRCQSYGSRWLLWFAAQRNKLFINCGP